MGSTDNAAAATAAKVSSNSNTNSGFGNSTGGEFATTSAPTPSFGLSGSVGIGGANAPEDIFQVSSALANNGIMDAPQDTADSTLFSGIISAQEGMDSGLKRDGLINPGGPQPCKPITSSAIRASSKHRPPPMHHHLYLKNPSVCLKLTPGMPPPMPPSRPKPNNRR